MTRVGVPAVFALGSLFGAAFALNGLAGCDCDCPPPARAPSGSFDVVEAQDPAVVGGTLTIAPDTIRIDYERPAGTRWQTVYRVQQ